MAYKYHQDIMVLCSSNRSASGGVYRSEQVNEQAIPMLKPTIETRSFEKASNLAQNEFSNNPNTLLLAMVSCKMIVVIEGPYSCRLEDTSAY
jgi:hypothetical protein